MKTFIAKDMKAALAAVRAELGSEAVMVSSHRAEDGNFVVRAALEEIPSVTPDPEPETETRETFESRYRNALVARLRGDMPADRHKRLPADRVTALAVLRAERTPDALAAALAEEVEATGFPDLTLALSRVLEGRLATEATDLRQGGALLLVGPPGSGKTSVAARLAADAQLAGQEVRLLATDTAGAGALARLETFADSLEIEVIVAESGPTLGAAIESAKNDRALLIGDTRGFDPRARGSWQDVLALKQAGAAIVGVVSALTDAEEAAELAAVLKELGAMSLISTCVDCARRRGTLLSLAASGLALTHVSRSPFVGDGLEAVTSFGLAREIVSRSAIGAETRRTQAA